jgi:hypothetical protein
MVDVYLNEFFLFVVLVFGVLSSIWITADIIFSKKRLSISTRLLWVLFAVLFMWGPSFFLWIDYVIRYRDPEKMH